MRQLLQNASIFLQIATVITKSDGTGLFDLALPSPRLTATKSMLSS